MLVKKHHVPRENIYKYMWISSDGRHINQIDHVLVNGRFENGTRSIRMLRGADLYSDHLLVGI